MKALSCFNLSMVDMKMSFLRHRYQAHGLRSEFVELDDGSTKIHCWTPCPPQPERGVWSVSGSEKPVLLFLHEFVGNGTMNWDKQISSFVKDFNVYVPDLVFFGGSTSNETQRTEAFQAECMVKMLQALEVYNEVTVVGAGYGGLVAFWMAHLYPKFVQKVVFVSSGTHMGPTSLKPVLTKFEYDHVSELLMPTTVKGLKNFASIATNKRVHRLPEFVCQDVLDALYDDQRFEKLELLNNMVCGSRNAPPLPELSQEKMLIIWGEYDQINNVDLAYKLSSHLGKASELVVLKECGHFPYIEQPQKFNRILQNFLMDTKRSFSKGPGRQILCLDLNHHKIS